MREPSAKVMFLTNNILASGMLDDSGGQSSLVGQVAPRRQAFSVTEGGGSNVPQSAA